MVKSMTGFGRSQVEGQGYSVSCEIKSVNHRYLDPSIRISRRYAQLEDSIKEELKQYVSRGRIEMSVNIEKTEDTRRNIKLDKDLAIAYYNYLKDLAEKLGISPEIKLIDVFRLPEVFSLEDDEEDLKVVWRVLKVCLQEALENLVEMRSKEGQNLARDIINRTAIIVRQVDSLETRSPSVVADYGIKLRKRIADFINQEVDEQRMLQEVAIFADRANVTEELVRLKSHIGHMEELMADGDSVGRKGDFLIQEMFREINTVASKANDIEMNRIVVDVKAELEKIREQIQNIE